MLTGAVGARTVLQQRDGGLDPLTIEAGTERSVILSDAAYQQVAFMVTR